MRPPRPPDRRPPPGPLHAFIAAPGFEPALIAELGRAPLGPRWPSVVTCRTPPGPVDPVFALQQLPGAVHVQAPSVRALAEAAYAMVDPIIDGDPGDRAFTTHAYVPSAGPYRALASRARLVGDELLALLRERRRRAFRRLVPAADAPAWGQALTVQLVLVGRGSLLVSAAHPRALPGGGFDVAPWPGGAAPVPEDRTAPSRAYRKLVEGFAWLGEAPAAGERCVDLGGSPGGWAWTALSRGASVVAVDRAALAPPAAGHERLAMVIGNAFTYAPPAPVDWLLCDVICEPARTFELVERWMRQGWCRRVVASVKFKGEDAYAQLVPARDRLCALGWRHVRIKHLQNHHNEAAILAAR